MQNLTPPGTIKKILKHIPDFIPEGVDLEERISLLEKEEFYDSPTSFVEAKTLPSYINCVVSSWQIVEIYDSEKVCDVLYAADVVDDRLHRFPPGGYVTTSGIVDFNLEKGLVQTHNTLYAVVGPGRRVRAQISEAGLIKYSGIPLEVIRISLSSQIDEIGRIDPEKIPFNLPWKIKPE